LYVDDSLHALRMGSLSVSVNLSACGHAWEASAIGSKKDYKLDSGGSQYLLHAFVKVLRPQ
jgi:hypothetical protein